MLRSGGALEYAKLFIQADTDHSGYVDVNELIKRMESMGYTPSRVQGLFRFADADRDGKLSFKEFLDYNKVVVPCVRYDALRFLFQDFDVDGDGKLSREELAAAFGKTDASSDEVNSLLELADVDGDGFINLKEFTEKIFPK